MIPASAVANFRHRFVNGLAVCRLTVMERREIEPRFSDASRPDSEALAELLDDMGNLLDGLGGDNGRSRAVTKAEADRTLHRLAGNIGLARANAKLATDLQTENPVKEDLQKVDELLADLGAITVDYRSRWLHGDTETLRETINRAATSSLGPVVRVSDDRAFDDLLASRFVREFLDEALFNAWKHGRPEVAVAAEHIDREIVIRISDQGPGFDPADVSHGFGMTILSDCAAALGGAYFVESDPCAVVLRFPVE